MEKVKEIKPEIKNKEKGLHSVGEYFLGKFTIKEYLEKEANLIIAKFK